MRLLQLRGAHDNTALLWKGRSLTTVQEGSTKHMSKASICLSYLWLVCILVFRTSKGDAMTVERTAEMLAAAMGLISATAVAWAMARLPSTRTGLPSRFARARLSLRCYGHRRWLLLFLAPKDLR